MRLWKTAGMVPLVLVLAAGSAAQDINIVSTNTLDMRTPVAVPVFAADDPGLAEIAKEMSEVVAYDLDFSGLFKLLSRDQFPPGFGRLPAKVQALDFTAWRATKAENLVYGKVARKDDSYVCEFRLFDLFSRDQVFGKQLRVGIKHPRLAAHKFSEEIIRNIEGVPGIGTSEICFSAGPTGKKEIYVADYDGANARQVTRHGSISIKPKMSPDGNKIAYLSYKERYCYLYVFDRRTGVSTPLSREPGLNAAPAWSPDGKTIALTLSKDGNTEIYLKSPDGSNARRLTRNRYGDTSPTFSPDGRRIAFVSDRGGTPQIYVMDVDGGNVRRLSYQGGSAYDPAWSPDGKHIAYVAERSGEGLQIYLMNADGTEPRRLMNPPRGNSESPSWSPDSRHIMCMSTITGRKRLWTLNATTGEARPVARLDMRCEGPSWGPRRN